MEASYVLSHLPLYLQPCSVPEKGALSHTGQNPSQYLFENGKPKCLNRLHLSQFWCNNHQLRRWGFFVLVRTGKAHREQKGQAGKRDQLVYQNIMLLQVVAG